MTIKDLAKLSGYSLGTVSRVLNNQPNVSEQARKTILALVEEHGFERNASAQLLKQQRTKSVLIIVKGTSNEMFAAMVEKLQSLFADTDHPVIADFIDEDENEVKRAVQLCRERKPSGVLFLGGNNENFRADFDKVLVPSVVVTNDAHELRFPNLSSVSTDDCAGASCAVEYLLRSGHRNIAVLGGDRLSVCQLVAHRKRQPDLVCVRVYARLAREADKNARDAELAEHAPGGKLFDRVMRACEQRIPLRQLVIARASLL